jgi:hypothetical protein
MVLSPRLVRYSTLIDYLVEELVREADMKTPPESCPAASIHQQGQKQHSNGHTSPAPGATL